MVQKSTGKHYREGIALMDMARLFSTENRARKWFEGRMWADGRKCPKCGGNNTHETAGHMPYRCSDCRRYFSVKTGTIMEKSPLPLRKWAMALYLHMTSLKEVSSMKLHRDIGVTQKTAWFMLQRIRKAWDSRGTDNDDRPFGGAVADETMIGGKGRTSTATSGCGRTGTAGNPLSREPRTAAITPLAPRRSRRRTPERSS